MKAILLCDTAGRKYDGAVKSAVKRLLPGATPHSPINVLTGELLVDYCQEGQPFNYQVYNDPNVLLFSDGGDSVSPLGEEDVLLLEAISRPADRIEVFRHKLEFGMALKEGSCVTITLPGANLSAPTRVRAVVHYKGKVGNQPGTLFGIEILDKTQSREKPGVSDGTFQGYRYFRCDGGYGLFVSLRWLSPADGDTAGTSLDHRDKQRGGELRPSYSQVTGGSPSQNTHSSGRPPYSKAASTDGSPSATRRSKESRSYMKSASRDDAVSSSKAAKAAASKGKDSESSVDPVHYRFKKGQRVMFYDNKGEKHYGTVGWTGNSTRTRTFDYILVGIRTDDEVFYKSDYENSLPGMDHLLFSAPRKHALFLPEALVEKIPEAGGSELSPRPARSDTAQEIAGVLNMSEDSLLKQQVELLKKAEKNKEEEAAVEAMKAAEQSTDFNKQQQYYEKLRAEAESAAKGQRASSHIYDDPWLEQFLDAGRGGAGAPAPYDPRYSPSSQRRQIHQQQHDGRPAQEQVVPSTDGSPSATPRSRAAPLYAKSASRDTARSFVPSTDPPALPRFKVGQRVMFYDNNGDKHYGTVGWTASMTITRSFPYTIVGIKTDDEVYFKSDFENSLPGMDHLFSAPRKHYLFLPEAFVEDIPNSESSELFKELETEINKEEEAAIEAIKALGVGCPTQLPVVDEDELGPANLLPEHVRDVEGASLLSPKSEQAEMLELKDLLSSKYLKLIHDHNELEARASILQANNDTLAKKKKELQSQVDKLTETLQAQTKTAVAAVKELVSKFKVQIKQAAETLQSATEKSQAQVQELKKSLEVQKREHKVREEELTSTIQDLRNQARKSRARVEELTSTIQELRKSLEDQERKSKATIQEQQDEIERKATFIANKDETIREKEEEVAELQKQLDLERQKSILNQPSNQSWKISRSEIQQISKDEIGSGAWGAVHLAKFRGKTVAIKITHRRILHHSTINMLKREVTIMSHLQHPNLVRFIAAVWDDAVERQQDTPIIVTELMEMNLRAAYERKIDLSNSLVSIFRDIAYALHYLHQHCEPIIHRDISAPNVLLKSLPGGSYRAKVSDFGSANVVRQAQTTGAGAIVYCAPEMFPNEDISVPPQPQTTKVDVFSYGILLLEVVSKEMPTPEKRYALLQNVQKKGDMMYALIVHCTKPSPSDRPAMADILNKLNSMPH